jgi:hypothetical protein
MKWEAGGNVAGWVKQEPGPSLAGLVKQEPYPDGVGSVWEPCLNEAGLPKRKPCPYYATMQGSAQQPRRPEVDESALPPVIGVVLRPPNGGLCLPLMPLDVSCGQGIGRGAHQFAGEHQQQFKRTQLQ